MRNVVFIMLIIISIVLVGCQKELLLEDDFTYIGEAKRDVPHGEGKVHYPSGQIFTEGQFADGEFTGIGIQYNENGRVIYDGQEAGDAIIGRYYNDRGTSVKEIKTDDEGVATGRFYYEDGQLLYRGDVKNDQFHDKGKKYFIDGSLQYEGDFREGMFYGNGKIYYQNNLLRYDGQFEQGVFEGKGKLFDEDQYVVYEGGFSSGLFHGEGKKLSRDGEVIYKGEFEDGEMHGYGRLYTSMKIVEGEFQNGKPNGLGREYNSSGKLLYEGSFVEGYYQGFGVSYNSDEERLFAGQFRQGRPNGEGATYIKGEIREEGTFRDGIFVSDALIYRKIEGNWLHNLTHDPFTVVFEFKNRQEGTILLTNSNQLDDISSPFIIVEQTTRRSVLELANGLLVEIDVSNDFMSIEIDFPDSELFRTHIIRR